MRPARQNTLDVGGAARAGDEIHISRSKRPRQNRVIIDVCHSKGFEPVVAARSSQIDFIVELAAAGMGAALLPRLLVKSHPRDGVISVMLDEPDVDWRLALVWRRGAYLSDAARAWQGLAMESRFD